MQSASHKKQSSSRQCCKTDTAGAVSLHFASFSDCSHKYTTHGLTTGDKLQVQNARCKKCTAIDTTVKSKVAHVSRRE